MVEEGFRIVIPVNYIESVNKLHDPVIRKVPVWITDKKTRKKVMVTRRVPSIVLSKAAKNAIRNYSAMFEKYAPKSTIPKLKYQKLEITYGLYFKTAYDRRDTDNCIKILQDVFAKYIGFNDNIIVTQHAYKRCISSKNRKMNKEFIYIQVTNNSKQDSELTVHEEDLSGLIGLNIL